MGFVFACGHCKTPLKGPADPGPGSVFKCPSCGQTETFENVKRIVAEYLQVSARDKLGELLRAATSRSESVACGAPRLTDVYRFVAIEADN